MKWLKICTASLVVLVVACGGGESGGVPTLTPTPPKTTTTVLPPAAADTTRETGPLATVTPRTGGAQDAPNRLFVNLISGSDTNEGKRTSPLLTLGTALNQAASIPVAEIFVTGGQINGTHNLSTSVRLFGGFDPETWEREGDNATSIVSSGYALRITGDGARVDGFTLQTTGTVGLNSVAVLVENATGVSLTNNKIIATNGVGGTSGARGTTGQPGNNGLPGQDASDCTSSIPGGAGGSGASGTGGSGGDGMPKSGIAGEPGSNGGGAGGKRGSPGQDGFTGGTGDKGTSELEAGVGGDGFGALDEIGYTPAVGKDGAGETGGGKPGGGGGGGGGGAGGIGSKQHGTGGSGGGASIGVLALNSEVSVSGSEITTGNGGPGGSGGSGARGGPGGQGGAGGARDVTRGAGGTGGAGGDSAPGGGGGGGPSIGVLANFNSNVTFSNNGFTPGSAGNGGAGGAPASSGGEPGVTGAAGKVDDFFRAQEPSDEEDES